MQQARALIEEATWDGRRMMCNPSRAVTLKLALSAEDWTKVEARAGQYVALSRPDSDDVLVRKWSYGGYTHQLFQSGDGQLTLRTDGHEATEWRVLYSRPDYEMRWTCEGVGSRTALTELVDAAALNSRKQLVARRNAAKDRLNLQQEIQEELEK